MARRDPNLLPRDEYIEQYAALIAKASDAHEAAYHSLLELSEFEQYNRMEDGTHMPEPIRDTISVARQKSADAMVGFAGLQRLFELFK